MRYAHFSFLRWLLAVSSRLFACFLAQDEDLVSACMSHLEAHKSAAELVEEMEPVLADEAEEFVIKVRSPLSISCLKNLEAHLPLPCDRFGAS